MIGVDLIGQIRRAYFEQRRPIKEIVRTLSVSRSTVRKAVRGHATEFKYARGVQPTPKLGEWIAVLTEILGREAPAARASAVGASYCTPCGLNSSARILSTTESMKAETASGSCARLG